MTAGNETKRWMVLPDPFIWMHIHTGDEAGMENQLYVDQGGHHYTYCVPNFEMYLKWVAKDW